MAKASKRARSKQAERTRRSKAAKRGWETRRRAARQAERTRRSKAAKRGWETRRGVVKKAPRRAWDAYDLEDIADVIGEDVEDLAEDLGLDIDTDDSDTLWDEFGEEDYEDLAEILDVDVSDIYGWARGSP